MSNANTSKQVEPSVLEIFTSELKKLEDKYLSSKRALTFRRISSEETIENPLLKEFTDLIVPVQNHSLRDYVGRLDDLMDPKGKKDYEVNMDTNLAVNLHTAGGLNLLHSSTDQPEIIDQYLAEFRKLYHEEAAHLRKQNKTIKDSETGKDKIVGKYSETEINQKLLPKLRSYFTLKSEAPEKSGTKGLDLFKEIRLRYNHKKEQGIADSAARSARISTGALVGIAGLLIAAGAYHYDNKDDIDVNAQALQTANAQLEDYKKAQTDAGALGQLINSHKLSNAEDFSVVQDAMNCYALHNGGEFEFDSFGGLLETLVGPYKLSSKAEQNVLGIVTENEYDGGKSGWTLDEGYDTCLNLE